MSNTVFLYTLRGKTELEQKFYDINLWKRK